MKFQFITIFPDSLKNSLEYGLVGQAVKKGLVEMTYVSPRQFAEGNYQAVDDRPFGGGDGMVFLAEPLFQALQFLESQNCKGKVVYPSPQGRLWTDALARKWAAEESSVTFICGRYGGIDQRLMDFVDEEISIGDYILNGGEVAAQVMVESIIRFLPGVLGNALSSQKDSFGNGLLEAPLWTRPRKWRGREVPDFLLSGHHQEIEEKRYYLSLLRTKVKRPELLLGSQEKDFFKALKWFCELSPLEQDKMGFAEELKEQLLLLGEKHL